MEVGVELHVPRAEGHAAGDVVDISAAADGHALAYLAGLLLVAAEQHLDKFGVSRHLVPRFHLARYGEPVALADRFHHVGAVLLGGTEGHAGVKLTTEPGAIHLDEGGADGDTAGRFVGQVDAQGAAVVILEGEHLGQGVDGTGRSRVRQGQLGEQAEQSGDGVGTFLRGGGVGVSAGAGDLHAAFDVHHFDLRAGDPTGGHGQRGGGAAGELVDDRFRLAGHHVDADAAVEGDHLGQLRLGFPFAGDDRGVMAFFDVDDGEFRVGREGAGRVGHGSVVVGDVPGATLFVGAQHQLHVAFQRDIQGFDALHGHHSGNRRAFVVIYPTSIDQVALLNQGVRIGVPPFAGCDHVQVRQDMQLVGAVVQVCREHISTLVFRSQTSGLGLEQSDLQRFGWAFPEGLAWACALAADTGDCHQVRDLAHHLLFFAGKPGFNRALPLIHGVPPFVLLSRTGICRRYNGRPPTAAK